MNADCLYYVHRYVIPATFDLLPSRMSTREAHAMLLAIGMQESRFDERVQIGGPAHGFWQFEKNGGIKGVLTHPSTALLITPVLQILNYSSNIADCYTAVVHNDVLACCFARLLLWTVPGTLPGQFETTKAWNQYLAGWRPGKPHVQTWANYYTEAWRTVLEE